MLTFAHKTSDATHQLIARLRHEVHDSQPRSVAFIAARSGEGTSTIAEDYAMGLANETGKKILLVVTDIVQMDGVTLYDVAQSRGTLEQAIMQHGNGVYQVQLGRGESASTLVEAYEAVQDALLEQVDVVVIDAPSLEQNGLGVLLASIVQAAVMVVAAETTPQPVVRNLQEHLLGAGVTIAGVVLNKRRYYIPQKLYKKL